MRAEAGLLFSKSRYTFPAMTCLSDAEINALAEGRHSNPFAVFGIHPLTPDDGGAPTEWVVRGLFPEALAVELVDPADHSHLAPMEHVAGGLFEGKLPLRRAYAFSVQWNDARTEILRDPYTCRSMLGEVDLYLLGEGQHWRLWEKLGAHAATLDGVEGTHFAVWAPNAERVSVVGDFNRWDGRRCPMRLHPSNGIWEIFLPGVGEGAHYKYEIRARGGGLHVKCDPVAFFAQHGIQTASLVHNMQRFVWNDGDWMHARRGTEWHRRPVSIYEVHLASWARKVEEANRPLSYRELGDRLIPYVKDLGFTHIELMPVAEHPFDGSWGYQVTGYFAPTSRFGNPDEFREFVDRCHAAGIGVILDWVPAHFPKDAHGLANFDGTALYEHSDPRKGEHRDWGTLIFNYGRTEVRNFLIANALFWLDQYHIDGLRVDAVASMLYLDYSREPGDWVPNSHGGRENLEAISFLKQFNEVCYEHFPGVMTIAEESTAWPMVSRPTYLGGLGFGFKWNMGWMNDCLRYMALEPIHRKYHQGMITFSLLYAFHEHFMLVLSHDEVVHGKGSLLDKMPGDIWQKFANLRMFYAFMFAHPGKKLLFMGGEFGQWREWDHSGSLDWHLLAHPPHAGLQRLVRDLNHLLTSEPALYEKDDSHEGFEWVDFQDAESSVFSFLRKSDSGEPLLFVVNATPVPRSDYGVGVPAPGVYREVLNTDAEIYGGSNLGNFGGRHAESVGCHDRPCRIHLTLPPLAVVVLRRDTESPGA